MIMSQFSGRLPYQRIDGQDTTKRDRLGLKYPSGGIASCRFFVKSCEGHSGFPSLPLVEADSCGLGAESDCDSCVISKNLIIAFV